MEGLPRPDVPPGGRRDLADALHALHHEAGWPSLRVLAREVGCSHTTVSTVFSSPRLPSWGLLELVVEALRGDREEFHRLWLAAGSPDAPTTATGIAGRRTELAVVRRHLETGTGLLLVTGEAGIGKTRLVATAAGAASDAFVATGSCLPLSVQVPLLAVADALRSAYDSDGGQWFKEALVECPPYVPASLRRLLPELGERLDLPMGPDDDWWLQRMFSAVGAMLSALGETRRLAVVLEDLHWADSTTLDLVEHLLVRPPAVPVVATFRLEDPSTPATTVDWLARTRRLPSVTTLPLAPLSRDETAELVRLVGAPTSADVDLIHRRSGGLPLFAEQLAAHPTDGEALPGLLADLLDRRLGGLTEGQTVVTRALGVADRPLGDGQLCAVTGLSPAVLTAELHGLQGLRLIVPHGEGQVRLAHPLLAEAVRRRLIGGEAAEEHRRLARVLAGSRASSEAEVAEHWRRAGDPEEELLWRIRAARAADRRFAAAQATDQWTRALELWPEDAESAGSPAVRRIDAVAAALDAGWHVDWRQADELAQRELRALGEQGRPGLARLYRLAGELQGYLGRPEVGLELVDRGLRSVDADAEAVERVQCLLSRGHLLGALDRADELRATTRLATELAAGLDDAATYRSALVLRSAVDSDAGRIDEALEWLGTAARVETPGPDPRGDVLIALFRTHVLLSACHGADEVVAAGRPGLAAVAAWGIDDFPTAVLRANIAAALRRAGRVEEAAGLVDPVTAGPFASHEWPVYAERGYLDLLRGRRREAAALLAALSEVYVVDLANRIACAQDLPVVELWCGRPESAHRRLTAVLDEVVEVRDEAADVAGLLVLAARAAADLAGGSSAGGARRPALVAELERLRARTAGDPFRMPSINGHRPALRATWAAEMGRLSGLAGSPALGRWAAAAAEWDRIGRPHDSAYCRWRGAQAAWATGDAVVGSRLLRRAGHDARGHVPLEDAIRATAAARTA